MAKNTAKAMFAEPVEDEETIAVPAQAVTSGNKRARIKGSWVMHWGGKNYPFEDGKTYVIPEDLFHHLKAYGNIYDTL